MQVEVRMTEDRAVNIHMFCARRPGLLLSTMRALDVLGLDIQQAVISCFNGFALDVFEAEVSTSPSFIIMKQLSRLLNFLVSLFLTRFLRLFQQCNCDGPGALPEEIKAALLHLLHSTGSHGMLY